MAGKLGYSQDFALVNSAAMNIVEHDVIKFVLVSFWVMSLRVEFLGHRKCEFFDFRR